MKLKVKLITLAMLFSIFSISKVYAMSDLKMKVPTPSTEEKSDNGAVGYRWTWLNDECCFRFKGGENYKRSDVQYLRDIGLISRWSEKIDGNWSIKSRETYIGAWSQSEDGKWSFLFDDNTIPIDITQIDGTLYAFNGCGELMEGFDYWNGQKTGADGVVSCDDPEFQEWLKTQYIPECFTRKEKTETTD